MKKKETCYVAQRAVPGDMYIDTGDGKLQMFIGGSNGSYIRWDGTSLSIASETLHLIILSNITETLDSMLAITKLLRIKKE